jgi:hypothetical protein
MARAAASAAVAVAAVAAGSAAAAPAFPFPPPPSSGAFPALWFGANASGLDSGETLALLRRSALVVYGWQQGTARTGFAHAEAQLSAAAAWAAAAVAPAPTPPVAVYRHFQMGWRAFDVQASADDVAAAAPASPAAAMFLHDDDNDPASAQCRQGIPSPPGESRTAPLWVFAGGNASAHTYGSAAGDFWVGAVVSEVAAEPGVSAVFFDETDWSACGYSFANDGCANISDSFRGADLAAKLPAIRGSVDALAAAGVVAILSSDNVVSAAWEGLPANATRPCVVPHDAYLAALAGGGAYLRFYEFWMGRGADLDAATIVNVQVEGAAGAGFVARAPAAADAVCPNASAPPPRAATGVGPGRLAAAASPPPPALEFAIAAFLVARSSPYSYFGVSTGWYDSDWCWHAAYDAVAGGCGDLDAAPAATRTGPYSWTRAFPGCVVAVDTAARNGTITYT